MFRLRVVRWEGREEDEREERMDERESIVEDSKIRNCVGVAK